MNIKKALTSRRTVLSFLIVISVCLVFAITVPQKGMTGAGSGQWFENGTGLAAAARWIGIDHLLTTRWFAALAAVFTVSLVLSTFDQYRASLARTRQMPPPQPESGSVGLEVLPDGFAASLRAIGYRKMTEGNGAARFVRAPWGYWGGFLFHAGIALAVLFWLVYIVTEHRAIVRLVEGEPVSPLEGSYPENKGVFAGRLDLPPGIRLDRLSPEFWENDQLKSLSSSVTFLGGDRADEKFGIGIGEKLRYRGMLVYQQNSFGNAFSLEIIEPSVGFVRELISLPMPARRDLASYGSFPLRDPAYTLKAKYFADAGKRTIYPGNPLLLLRLLKGDQVEGEVALKVGETGPLGPYTVRLGGVRWWTDILFDGSTGTSGIFAGFGMILAGVFLSYFSPPREVLLWKTEKGYNIVWKAGRFRDFYRDEESAVIALCKGSGRA